MWRFTRLSQKYSQAVQSLPPLASVWGQPIAVANDLAGLVKVPRFEVERPKGRLIQIPSDIVVAGLQAPHGLGKLRRGDLNAGFSFCRSEFLDDRVDSAADKVGKRDVQAAPSIGDHRHSPLDVSAFPRLDGVGDQPFPVLDFQSAPLRGAPQ